VPWYGPPVIAYVNVSPSASLPERVIGRAVFIGVVSVWEFAAGGVFNVATKIFVLFAVSPGIKFDA
jgi:hypothetical protein